MFAPRYFAPHYFTPRYWPPGGDLPPPPPTRPAVIVLPRREEPEKDQDRRDLADLKGILARLGLEL